MIFDKKQYAEICSLVKERKWNAVKSLNISADGLREYLSIHTFLDQKQKQYVATVYDSDELYQNPQIIDIFSLD